MPGGVERCLGEVPGPRKRKNRPPAKFFRTRSARRSGVVQAQLVAVVGQLQLEGARHAFLVHRQDQDLVVGEKSAVDGSVKAVLTLD